MKLIINDWSGGLVPHWWENTNLKKIGADNQFASGVVNPLIYPGFLTPGVGTGSATALKNIDQLSASSTDGDLRNFVPVDDGNQTGGTSIYTGQNNKIHVIDRILAGGEGIVTTAPFPHTISSAGANETVCDLALYQLNGSLRLWYFYTDDAKGDGGTYDFSGDSFTTDSAAEDVWSTATGSAVLSNEASSGSNKDAIIVEVASNGYMYVMNGNSVHKMDGSTDGGAKGTVTRDIISFSETEMIVDARDHGGYMWMALTSTDNLTGSTLNDGVKFNGVAVWDKNSSAISINEFIPVPGATRIKNLFFYNGLPHLFTIGNGGITELRQYDGNSFKVIKEIGDGNDYPVNRHAIIDIGTGFVWQSYDTDIWYYGKISPEIEGNALYKIMDFSNGAGEVGNGGIIRVHDEYYYIYYRTSTPTNNFSSYKPFNDTYAVNQGNYYSKVYQLPKLSRIKSMDVYYPAFTSTADANITFKIYLNYSSVLTKELTINYKADSSKGFKHFLLGGENFDKVNAVQIEIEWATGYANNASITPSRIEMEYEETGRIK